MITVRAIGDNLIASAITLICGLGFAPIFFRALGAEEFGVFGMAQLLVGAYSLLEFGSGAYLVRELAKSLAASDDGRQAKSVVQFGIVFCLLSAAAGAVLLFLTAVSILSLWSPGFHAALSSIVHLVATLAFLTMVQVFLASLLSGCQLQNVAAWFSACSWILRLALGWFWLSRVPPSAGTLLESQIFVVFFVVLAQALFVWDRLRQRAAMPKFSGILLQSRSVWKGYLRFGSHYFPATILGFLASNVDRILLMRVLGATEFGCFTVAKNLVSGMFAIAQVVTSYAYPVFAASQRDRDGLLRSYFGMQFALAFLLLPPVVALLAAPEFLMTFYSGDKTLADRIAWYLTLLIVGFVLSMTGSLAQTLLVATGREKSYLNSISLSLAVVALGWVVFEMTGSLRDFFLISAISAAMSSALSLYVAEKNSILGLTRSLLLPGWLLPWLLGLFVVLVSPAAAGRSWIGVAVIFTCGLISAVLPNHFVYRARRRYRAGVH